MMNGQMKGGRTLDPFGDMTKLADSFCLILRFPVKTENRYGKPEF